MNNVTPGFLYETIIKKVETGKGKTLPIIQSNGKGESVSFKLDPAIEEIKTGKNITPQVIKESFGDGQVKIEFSKIVIPFTKINEAGVNSKEKFHTLFFDASTTIPLGELFKLARVTKELSLLAQDLLMIQLISRTDLESIIPCSGKMLYGNLVNPETFKTENAEIFKKLREAAPKNNSVISNSLNSADEVFNTNFLLSLFRKSEDINFIRFCKENEVKPFGDEYTVSKEDDIKDSEAAPVSVNETDPSYVSIGNVNSIDSLIAKQTGLL